MTRRERILYLLQGKSVDRVPISTYGLDRYSHKWMAEDPSYRRILEYTDEYDNIFALHCSYYASVFGSDVLAFDDPQIMKTETYRKERATYYRSTLYSPKGNLTCLHRINDDAHTTWSLEYPIKGDEDIDRFMSLPFVPRMPDVNRYKTLQEELGDRGIVEIEVPDPLCLVVENMDYQDFMIRTLSLKGKMQEFFDFCLQLVLEWLEKLLKSGFGPVYRIFGPEYGAPPYMPLQFFKDFVVKYDSQMINLIHKYGCYARVHSHGPLIQILDDILTMGPDLLDPCEGPPNGDITFKELASRVGDQLILMGNIELGDIEMGTPEQIDRLVAEAIEAVHGKARHILLPTAFPFVSPLPKRTEENEIQFIESGMKYGKL